MAGRGINSHRKMDEISSTQLVLGLKKIHADKAGYPSTKAGLEACYLIIDFLGEICFWQ